MLLEISNILPGNNIAPISTSRSSLQSAITLLCTGLHLYDVLKAIRKIS